jgi:hypothetical protein
MNNMEDTNDREVLARLYWRNQGYEDESFDAGGLDGNSVYREAWGMADVILAAAFRRTPETTATGGSPMDALTQALREYASAIRGDWSDFDGRTGRDVIERWAWEFEKPDPEHTIEWWRGYLGICPDGNGHWAGSWGHCRVEDCPTFAAEQERQ